MSVPVMLLVVLVALSAGLFAGRALARVSPSGASPDAEPEPRPEDGMALDRLRAQALDASLEAILIVTPDGRVRDCNAAALPYFDRHRTEVEALEAVTLRRLFSGDGREMNWETLVASRAPWMGDGLIRLPDGSTRECLVRTIPLFTPSGAVDALVEVHRDPRSDGSLSTRAVGFPHSAALASDADGERGGEAPGERRDLRFLAAAFHDLDRVVRQYQRLLPAMRAEDPLSEVIAGVAAETNEVTESVDVPTLLREIPRVLGRLDAQLARRESSPASPAAPPAGD